MTKYFLRGLGALGTLLWLATATGIGQISNGSFESGGGSYTAWTTIGQASIQNTTLTPPPAGAYQALIQTAGGAPNNAAALSTFFNGVSLPGNGQGAATDGSGFKQIFISSSGFLSFNWKFVTSESTSAGYDSAFYFLDGKLITLVVQPGTTPNLNAGNKPSTFNFGTPYTLVVTPGLPGGVHTLGFGVYDTGDTSVSSGLVIDDILFTDLSLALDLRGINLGVFETATRDVNSRLFRLRLRSTDSEPANVGLAAAYSPQGRELVSLGIDGRQTVNFKDTSTATKRFEVFAQGDFSRSDRDSVDAAAGFGGWTEAGSAGIEYNLTDRLTTGFAIGYVHNNTNINNGVGSIDIDGMAVSAYASWFKNNFYLDGLYSFSFLENDLQRNTATGVATAKPASYGNTLALNTGYNFMNYPGIVAGPIGSLTYTHGEIDGFTDSTNVAVQSQSYDSLISQIGWQASFPRAVRYGKLNRLTPQLHGAWAHQYMNQAEFVSAQFGGFTATGKTPEPRSDYAALGAGIMAEFGGNLFVTLDYQADVGSTEVTHFVSLRGGFKF